MTLRKITVIVLWPEPPDAVVCKYFQANLIDPIVFRAVRMDNIPAE